MNALIVVLKGYKRGSHLKFQSFSRWVTKSFNFSEILLHKIDSNMNPNELEVDSEEQKTLRSGGQILESKPSRSRRSGGSKGRKGRSRSGGRRRRRSHSKGKSGGRRRRRRSHSGGVKCRSLGIKTSNQELPQNYDYL